jgi:hypothetical protein
MKMNEAGPKSRPVQNLRLEREGLPEDTVSEEDTAGVDVCNRSWQTRRSAAGMAMTHAFRSESTTLPLAVKVNICSIT